MFSNLRTEGGAAAHNHLLLPEATTTFWQMQRDTVRVRHSVSNPPFPFVIPSPLTPHPLTPHPSPLTPHPSPLTIHPSPLTPHLTTDVR